MSQILEPYKRITNAQLNGSSYFSKSLDFNVKTAEKNVTCLFCQPDKGKDEFYACVFNEKTNKRTDIIVNIIYRVGSKFVIYEDIPALTVPIKGTRYVSDIIQREIDDSGLESTSTTV